MTISRLDDLLRRSARRFPERPAVEDLAGVAITYRQLHEESDRIRDQLVSQGVRAGDRVGLCVPKSVG